MKLGDIIHCLNEKDLIQTMKDLSVAGFHAVRDSGNNFNIRLTGTPESEYLVEARDQNGRVQKAYCSTLEEAYDAAAEYGNSYEFVDILKGYAGEWRRIDNETL